MTIPYCFFAAYVTLSSVVACCNATAQEPKPANKKTTKEVAAQTVIAEGSGSSADEALKSAFRAAVQQVVGAVVSAETIVKDDAIIADKILTYSDGFIEKYEELPGSKTVNAGVHRVKVKAVVQRKNLVAKLKAENVAMIAVDGTGVFAEAFSKLQSEKDAAALLEAEFKGFPESCIKASVVGKPRAINNTEDGATLVFTVVMEPDLIAYKAFQARLTGVLGKMSNQPDDFTAKFSVTNSKSNFQDMSFQKLFNLEPYHVWRKTIVAPDKKGKPKGELYVVVATSQSKTADSMNFRYFPIDKALEPLLIKSMSRQPKSQLQLFSSEGLVASVDVPVDKSMNNFFGSLDKYDIPKIYLVTPAFKTDTQQYIVLSNKVSMDLKIKLSFEQIKSISEAKVEINVEK